MKRNNIAGRLKIRHGIAIVAVLCLFGILKAQDKMDDDSKVYLIHADVLHFDQKFNPDAKILNGNVQFFHKGARLYSDSAYFYEASNSFEAFSNVRLYQGDTLSLYSDYAYYDGNEQMAMARYNVVLTHNQTVLYTDSLNYDRLYDLGYFFEGGKMVDGTTTLISDWGEYDSKTHQSVFNYDVRMRGENMFLTSDTLYYNTDSKLAHVLGPSNIFSRASHVYTEDGYYNMQTERSELYSRSVVNDGAKQIVADSIYHNSVEGISEAFSNVVYNDTVNKNMLKGDYCWYEDSTGYAMCTRKAIAVDYSQGDSLYMHADTFKLFTYDINTDSVYRVVHGYNKVRAYRTDVQAVCDSIVFISRDSCLYMYKDPILWNNNQQVLGEEIRMYLNDSTIERTHVIGQALSVQQQTNDSTKFDEIASKEMVTYFHNGEVRMSEAIDNVLILYYMIDDSDSSYIGLNYTETTLARMFMEDRKMKRIWTPKATGTIYPVTQIPPSRRHLESFAWFDYIRPKDKDDILSWRGKSKSFELRPTKRREAPLQHIAGGGLLEPMESERSNMVAVDTTIVDAPIAVNEQPEMLESIELSELTDLSGLSEQLDIPLENSILETESIIADSIRVDYKIERIKEEEVDE